MGKDILQSILQEFAPNTKEQWEKQAEKDLKGVPLDKLNWQINEELEQFAYASNEDIQDFDTSALKNYKPDWQIAAHYNANENKQILADLQMGLTAPVVDFTEAADFNTAYKDVQAPYIFNHFKTKSGFADIMASWKNFLTEQNYQEEETPAFFHFNASYFSSSLQKEWQDIVLNNTNKQWKTIRIDAQKQYNGKENVVEELKNTLAEIKETLNYFKQSGLSEEAFHNQVFFTFYVDKSYLLSIAKLRAFKLAYTKIFNTKELPFVLVEFAPDAYDNDAQDNLINATTMAMSAVLGGANCLLVKPTQNNEDGKRLARNIQLILKHESGLHHLADPANGSFYIESLTKKMVEKII